MLFCGIYIIGSLYVYRVYSRVKIPRGFWFCKSRKNTEIETQKYQEKLLLEKPKYNIYYLHIQKSNFIYGIRAIGCLILEMTVLFVWEKSNFLLI